MADFTVAAGVKAPDFDPLKTVATLQGVQQGQLQNRLLGMKLQGQQALGQIIGQNTNPQTGEVDYAGASRDAASDPSAAILLPEFQAQALQRQLTQVQLQREQLGFTGDQWNVVGNAAMQLLGEKDKDGNPVDLTPDHVSKTIADTADFRQMLGDPRFTTRLTSFLTDLKDKDPQQVRQALQGIAIMANPTAERVGLVNGAIDTVDTGGKKITRQVSPLQGTANTVGGNAAELTNTLSPESKASPRAFVDSKGVQHAAPTSAFVDDQGNPRPNQPGLTGPNGETTTSLAPGEAEARGQPVVARGHRAAQIEESASGSAQRIANLDEMKAALSGFRPGPGAAKTSSFVTEANRILGTNFAANEVGAQQAFDKLAEQVSAQQREAMGLAATNAQLDMAHNASPNGQRSPEAIGRVWAQLRGNEDWINARNKAWALYQNNGGSIEHLNDFEQQFYQNFDPKMFQFQYMTPNQRGELARAMGPDGFKAWQAKRQKLLSLKGIQ